MCNSIRDFCFVSLLTGQPLNQHVAQVLARFVMPMIWISAKRILNFGSHEPTTAVPVSDICLGVDITEKLLPEWLTDLIKSLVKIHFLLSAWYSDPPLLSYLATCHVVNIPAPQLHPKFAYDKPSFMDPLENVSFWAWLCWIEHSRSSSPSNLFYRALIIGALAPANCRTQKRWPFDYNLRARRTPHGDDGLGRRTLADIGFVIC